MFILNKQVFIILSSFRSSLATKCLSLNDQHCMVRPTFIDLNPLKPKCYPSMVSLNKYSKCCNVLSPKICVP